MTASSHKMTCEACRDALTDYACKELDGAAADAVREHVSGCVECAAQLARFERVMTAAAREPLDVPPPQVRAQVMLHAREALTRRTAQQPVTVPAADAPSSGLRDWLARLGHWAMAPQVAMATVLLLMVGIGLYALPFGEQQPRTALTPALEPHAPEGAETAAATTSPIVEGEAQKARDGLSAPEPEADRSVDDVARRARSSSQFAPKPPARRKEKSADAEREQSWVRDDALGSAGLERSAKKSASSSKPATPSKSESKAPVMEERAGGQFAPPPSPAPKGAAAWSDEGAPTADRARAAPAASTAAEASPSAPAEQMADQPASVDDGIRRMQAGDPTGAIRILRPLLSSGIESERQQARIWLARSYRASGDCKSALVYYAALVSRKDAGGAILMEAADCYARVGDEAQASTLRARAKNEASAPKAASEQ